MKEYQSNNEGKVKSRNLIAKAIKRQFDGNSKWNGIVITHLGGIYPNYGLELECDSILPEMAHYNRFEENPNVEWPKLYLDGASRFNRFEEHLDGDSFYNAIWKNEDDILSVVWLDFCATPTNGRLNLAKEIYDIEGGYCDTMFLTFFTNGRSMGEYNHAFEYTGRGSNEANALGILELLKREFRGKVELVMSYVNEHSPMSVYRVMNLKSTRSHTAKMKVYSNRNGTGHLKFTPETYATWHNDGHANQDIGNYYGLSKMQIAGYAARAKMRGLV